MFPLWFFHCVPWLLSAVEGTTKNDDVPRSTNGRAYFQVTKLIDDRFVGQESDILREIVGLVRQTSTIRFTAILRFYWVDTFENAYASRWETVWHGTGVSSDRPTENQRESVAVCEELDFG